ncbi:MAG: GDP-mannose 4,6-dehydratase [Chitinophagales bacterium]|nr:GDP-mannose 4,6-dehydratase [Chitinophagales bacterium]
MKKALIIGVSGQDGAYLAEFLLKQGYEVFGGSRDAGVNAFSSLQKIGIKENVKPVSVSLIDFRSILQVLNKIKPDEIYNLSGQSSVGLSFEQPVETLESISVGTLNLLEAVRYISSPIKIYNAGSSECFGDAMVMPANEETPFRPRSPYAVAKAAAFWKVSNYREAYNIFASTGILFNHESPLRPERFVTRKIIRSACRISKGENLRLKLGNLNIERDWGWAPEYVQAMWLMMQQDQPDDFVIATGRSVSLQYFVDYTFRALNMNYKEYVDVDTSLFRPTDLLYGKADPSKAEKVLGWRAATFVENVIDKMIESELSTFK